MIIRVEFSDHKSPRFAWLLRLCRKFPSYKQVEEDGMTIYSIEFTEKEAKQFEAIHKILYGFRQVAYFVDGELFPQGEIFKMIWEYESQRRLDKWAAREQERARMRSLFYKDPNNAFLARLKKHGLFGQDN